MLLAKTYLTEEFESETISKIVRIFNSHFSRKSKENEARPKKSSRLFRTYEQILNGEEEEEDLSELSEFWFLKFIKWQTSKFLKKWSYYQITHLVCGYYWWENDPEFDWIQFKKGRTNLRRWGERYRSRIRPSLAGDKSLFTTKICLLQGDFHPDS